MADKKEQLDAETISLYEESLRRCNAAPNFLDVFYDKFLASSPEIRARFAKTDFVRQKRALRASFYLIITAVGDKYGGPENYLKEIAIQHSRHHLGIGAALYDLWLDSLLETVKECDPECDPYVLNAWDLVMVNGIDLMLSYYNHE